MTFRHAVLSRRRHRLRLLTFALLAAPALVAGCGGEEQEGAGRPVVAATAPQLDALTRTLAGDGVQVREVVPASADIHDLELRPSQVRALKDADLIVRPGRGGDAWAQEALDAAGAEQLDAGARLRGAERHWWMDPLLAADAARAIADRLDRLDPDGAGPRGAALGQLTAQLHALDIDAQRCLGSIPPVRRVIVTDHDAAGAFADRYGLEVAATIAPGADPEASASAQRLVELLDVMQRRRVAAVFPIAPHGGELAETVAERAGVPLGEPLWADALPAEGGEAHHDHAHGEDDADGAEAGGDAHGSEEHEAEPAATHAAERTAAQPLLDAGYRNIAAVAKALGGTRTACGDLLD